ncbi:hypothetical protein SERLA73DRAFT_131362, partial [Serpula lacrymans var. lacrymans S7.3]
NANDSSAKKQIAFFIPHYNQWKNDFDKLSGVFREGCEHEIALWEVAELHLLAKTFEAQLAPTSASH